MNKKKALIAAASAYVVLLAIIAGIYIYKGSPNYLTYKSYIRSITKETNVSASKPASGTTPQQTQDKGENTNSNGNNKADENKNTEQGKQGNTAANTTSEPNSQPGSAETYAKVQFTRPLQIGLQGDDVKKLQYLLSSKKLYEGEATGVFDQKTKDALKKFQASNGLTADGVLGKVTWTKLLEAN